MALQELLAKMVGFIETNPGATVGMVAAVMVAVVIWGVVFSSYRYR